MLSDGLFGRGRQRNYRYLCPTLQSMHLTCVHVFVNYHMVEFSVGSLGL